MVLVIEGSPIQPSLGGIIRKTNDQFENNYENSC